ncbi:hypothetical protein CC80DRAFT_489144 [Byssothecium circinans]|uniref:F-box domain-containing protein n=1 Tax=Byssothecium circinans TaxID=147558 RepID=A0A6A5UAQ1_9PLEO|nr:hypothetical protein CC80DRAFT_489144 [Byssothecium circinans]
MGTRGLYAYKYRGRYYVYYNHWDSYPEGLGKELAGNVPSDPDKFKAWLESMRKKYAELERRLEHECLCVSPEELLAEPKKARPFNAEDEGMEGLPLFTQPQNTLFIEYVYIFDLDNERFSCNGCSHFHLSKVTNEWIKKISAAEALFFGDDASKGPYGDEFCTTPASRRALPSYDPTAAYNSLNPKLVNPKMLEAIADFCRKPAPFLSLGLFKLFAEKHENAIVQARDTFGEKELLFREMSFGLLSLASCSPKLIRLIDPKRLITEPELDYAVLKSDDLHRKRSELVSKLTHGYHIPGKPSGNAPEEDMYWLADVLICLKRDVDLISNAGFRDAIVSTVAHGRSEGKTVFRAVICSIGRVVLIHATEDRVVHTNCLPFTTPLEDTFDRYDDDDRRINGLMAIEGPEDPSLVESSMEQEHTFHLIARLFEDAQLQTLRPSSIANHGVFPNEIYKDIISHVDPITRITCANVSRAFRDFASDVFEFDRGLRLEYRAGTLPKFVQFGNTDIGELKLKCSDPELYGRRESSKESTPTWIPVIGFDDGTAFFEPDITMTFSDL